MKALVQSREYPLNITSSGQFNLNNKDWHKIDGRIDIEETFSRSTIKLLYPKNSSRDTQMLYAVDCKSNIPDVPVAEVENYFNASAPLNIRISATSDSWKTFPLNTWKMSNFSYSPSDIYGTFMGWGGQKPYILIGNQYWNANYATYVVAPQWRVPVISGITPNQNDPRLPIVLTWSATIQDIFDIEIWQAGVKKYTASGGAERTSTIPANVTTAGAYDVKIVSANNPLDDLGVTGTVTSTLTATMPTPTVSNITLNQTEIRQPMVFNWTSTGQTNYKLELIQNESARATLTGGAELAATLGANMIAEGATIARVTVYNTVNGVSSSAFKDYSFTATVDRPVIASLEPDGINQNVDEPIIVTWSATLQDSYTLTVKQNNVVLQTYNGTTAKTVTLPANLASSGTVSLELMARSTVNGTTVSASKTASFLGYGKPPLPVFGEQTIFNVAKPTLTWSADEQVAYVFEIYKGEVLVETTGEKLGPAKSYTALNILDNNSDYILKVKIKNQFNLWSDFATKTISMKYTTLQKPIVTAIAGQGAILINADCGQETEFAYAEIWRKTEYVPWTRIALNMGRNISLNDTTVASQTNYSYKIISYSSSGGAIESDIASSLIDAVLLPFLTLEDIESKESMELPYLKGVSYESIRNIALQNFAGISKPRKEKGIISYRQAQMSVLLDIQSQAKLINMLDNAKVILLRDRIGNKMFCSLSSNIAEGGNQYVNYRYITFTLTELAFLEKDIYSGTQKLVLIYFDGQWRFDGAINFNGQAYITS